MLKPLENEYICPVCHQRTDSLSVSTLIVYSSSLPAQGGLSGAVPTTVFQETDPADLIRRAYPAGVRHYVEVVREGLTTEKGEPVFDGTLVDRRESIPGINLLERSALAVTCCDDCEGRFADLFSNWVQGHGQ